MEKVPCLIQHDDNTIIKYTERMYTWSAKLKEPSESPYNHKL